MRTPTTAQLRTAIEVLKMPGERINNDAANAVMGLTDAERYDRHPANIEAQSIGQISRIETVTVQLEQWRNQLQQQRRQSVTHDL